MVELLCEGKTFEEIQTLNKEQNVFGAPSKARRTQIYSTVSARIQSLDASFYDVFMKSDVTGQKQMALAAALANDTLFYEFVFEVIHENMVLGRYEVTDADVSIFFQHKQVQEEKVAKWTDKTIQKLGQVYRTMLADAGILGKGKEIRQIIVPLLDPDVEDWLNQHDMSEIVRALSDR